MPLHRDMIYLKTSKVPIVSISCFSRVEILWGRFSRRSVQAKSKTLYKTHCFSLSKRQMRARVGSEAAVLELILSKAKLNALVKQGCYHVWIPTPVTFGCRHFFVLAGWKFFRGVGWVACSCWGSNFHYGQTNPLSPLSHPTENTGCRGNDVMHCLQMLMQLHTCLNCPTTPRGIASYHYVVYTLQTRSKTFLFLLGGVLWFYKRL